MSENIIHLSEADFEQTVAASSAELLLVDFWAEWCGPCKVLAPILDELANEYDTNKVKIAKVDVDQNPQVAAKFGIRSIPTLLLFKQGQLVETKVGVLAKGDLKNLLDSHL